METVNIDEIRQRIRKRRALAAERIRQGEDPAAVCRSYEAEGRVCDEQRSGGVDFEGVCQYRCAVCGKTWAGMYSPYG